MDHRVTSFHHNIESSTPLTEYVKITNDYFPLITKSMKCWRGLFCISPITLGMAGPSTIKRSQIEDACIAGFFQKKINGFWEKLDEKRGNKIDPLVIFRVNSLGMLWKFVKKCPVFWNQKPGKPIITLHYHHFKHHLHLKWPVVRKQLHFIRNTAHRPLRRLATQQVGCHQKAKSAVAAQIVATLKILSFPWWLHMSLASCWGQQRMSLSFYVWNDVSSICLINHVIFCEIVVGISPLWWVFPLCDGYFPSVRIIPSP